ncbi:hypothetical protein CERZMDRAFT_86659 [Cercospora zeae-maydis SCOH1-5]|uniref:FAS1 domain-containing protein n=1 Tax=Cercospora zeae-maydis SCOH1-5 TaxID=717836 RepID=A0A6A6F8M2_9PEZI|nr:hypothetical protein CERZMDRAFT_86659 [Cercospora zeae-maydis SCOH1-5]
MLLTTTRLLAATAALAALTSAQDQNKNPNKQGEGASGSQTEDAAELISVVSVLQTALPSSILNEALTNSAGVSSQLASQFHAGETPTWFSDLPNGVKTYLVPTLTNLPSSSSMTITTTTTSSETGSSTTTGEISFPFRSFVFLCLMGRDADVGYFVDHTSSSTHSSSSSSSKTSTETERSSRTSEAGAVGAPAAATGAVVAGMAGLAGFVGVLALLVLMIGGSGKLDGDSGRSGRWEMVCRGCG